MQFVFISNTTIAAQMVFMLNQASYVLDWIVFSQLSIFTFRL